MSAESSLRFLRQLQLLLEEGALVATYKYALLQALADLSVEQEPGPDGRLLVPIADLGEKFIEYYWRQTLPFGPTSAILHQNTGKQAAIINYVSEAQRSGVATLAALRRDQAAWSRLRRRVASKIRDMPLWRLQVLPGGTIEFLYRKAEFREDSIWLLPSVPSLFREFHGLITTLVRGAWIASVQRLPHNRTALGETSSLEAFLFGTERVALGPWREILRRHQSDKCFYCGSPVGRDGAVDHFIPWSRYPVDLGHNFVLSHSDCNSSKRDRLAHPHHLRHWRESNLDRGGELAAAFDVALLPHDVERSRRIAVWAYGQGELAGAHAWIKGKQVEALGGGWRSALGLAELHLAAEARPDYG